MFKKASKEERLALARAVDPATFDRLMARTIVGTGRDCWPSRRSVNSQGYSRIKIRGKSIGSHRAMFQLFFPGVDAPVVRHMCNRPNCINPAHLRPGTQLDNVMDRVMSGRSGNLKGEANGRSKLDASSVLKIQMSSESGSVLAVRFGISKAMACRIKRGDAWKHL